MPAPSEPTKPMSTKAAAAKPATEAVTGRPKLVAVKITANGGYGRYNQNETAGFKPKEAESIVSSGLGEFVKAKK